MDKSVGGRIRFARALRWRPYALLWSGQTISALGDGAFFTAMPWTVLLLTHSATAMGAVAIAEMLPRVAFLLIGGVTADRLPRRLILLWSDAGRGVAVFTVTALAWTGALQLWHIIALSLLFGLADGFFMPAYNAIPPQLVPEEDLPSANSLTSIGRQMSVLVGPALGAFFIAVTGVRGAFLFDGLTFAFSAACLVAMGALPPASAGALGERPATGTAPVDSTAALAALDERMVPDAGTKRQDDGFFAQAREGFRYILGSTWLWVTILLAAIGNMCWTGTLSVAAPKLIADFFHSGVWLLGALQIATAVGSIAATLVVGNLRRLRWRGPTAYLGILLSSLALASLGLPLPLPPVVQVGVGGALIGVGLGVFEPIWTTTLQQLVPAEKLGRVSSVDWLGSLVMSPLGMGVAGVLTDRVGAGLVFLGAGLLNTAIAAIGLSVRGIRELD